MRMDPKYEKANEIYFRLGIIYKGQQKYAQSLEVSTERIGNSGLPFSPITLCRGTIKCFCQWTFARCHTVYEQADILPQTANYLHGHVDIHRSASGTSCMRRLALSQKPTFGSRLVMSTNSKRRYVHLLQDLVCVLTVPRMNRYF